MGKAGRGEGPGPVLRMAKQPVDRSSRGAALILWNDQRSKLIFVEHGRTAIRAHDDI